MEQQTNDNYGGTIGIQLNRLNNVEMVEYRGKKCVVIPVDDNGIYISDKGTVILSLFMAKMGEEKWGKTHSIKRKLTGNEYKSMTRQQRDNNPVIGYFEPYKRRENTQQQKTQPTMVKRTSNNDVSDLPW